MEKTRLFCKILLLRYFKEYFWYLYCSLWTLVILMFLPEKESGLELNTERNDNTNLDFWGLRKKNLNQLIVTHHNINYIRKHLNCKPSKSRI